MAKDGRLTSDASYAQSFPTLKDAVVVCIEANQHASDFVYRMIEPVSPWFTQELASAHFARGHLRA